MNFGESVLFATIMTLMDEAKNSSKGTEAYTSVAERPSAGDAMSFHYNAVQAKSTLCRMAQELFDKADSACGTKTDVTGAEIVSVMINGIIFEAVCSIDRKDHEKKSMYQAALAYCDISSNFEWEYISSGKGEMAKMLLNLSDMAMNLIVVAASRGGDDKAGVGFVKTLTEFMLFLEENIMQQFSLSAMQKRFPIVVLEKAAMSMEKEMKRMEEEDPSIAEQTEDKEKKNNLTQLRTNARLERNIKNMNSAAAYYREILKAEPDDWEALFYSVFCAVYESAYTVRAFLIPQNAKKIADCASDSMRQAKKKLFSQMEKLTELGDVATLTCELASNYFVASMNAYKASNKDRAADNTKTYQVNSIIQMLFALGDAIEKNFGDDYEICKNICCPCWKIAFDCYENCNMGVPSNLYDYYQRILKYDPSFRCLKPLVGSNSENQGTGGCYVATCVYGSYDCPEVWTLRRFRDEMLAKSVLGRVFIRAYYAISPTIVCWFGKTDWFQKFWKARLDRMVASLTEKGVENTPYQDRDW